MRTKSLLAVFFIIASIGLTACTPNSSNPANSVVSTGTVYPINTDIEGASKIIGITLPIPTYFPENYKINEIEVTESNTVAISISNNVTPDKNIISLQIAWISRGPFGIKLPGESVNIKGVSDGVIVDRDDHNALWWDWKPNTLPSTSPAYFEFVISASKSIPKEELVLVARSVQQ